MQSVCANNEIETSRTRLLKRHIHSHSILAEGLDEITECSRRRLHSRHEGFVEIAACNLDVFGHDRRSQRFDIDARDPPSGQVQRVIPCNRIRASRSCARTFIRSATSTAGPRTSTGLPLERSERLRSMTVTE